jgi:glycosyltransferase involved in cell wall biosynthesis
MSLTVAVITSTRGRETIKQANESIRNQTYKATHYVFAHGRDCWDAVERNMREIANAQVVNLPRANGGGGYGMAPVFALAPFVVEEDIICYLDDDNWYEPDHIESLVEMIEKHDLGWAYSLRKVVDNDGNFICEDNCESLGCVPNASGQYLVDNSCYAVRTDVARKHSHAWYVPIVSDRNFQAELMRAKISAGTTGKHSVNYRLSKDGTGGMTKEKFLGNNEWMKQNHPHFQWTKKQIFNF